VVFRHFKPCASPPDTIIVIYFRSCHWAMHVLLANMNAVVSNFLINSARWALEQGQLVTMTSTRLFYATLLAALGYTNGTSQDFKLKHRLTCAFKAQVASVSTTPRQVVSGIGASGAWWPIDVFNFPDSARQQAAKLLFDASPTAAGGAGLTSYRYNIGGGGVFVGNPTWVLLHLVALSMQYCLTVVHQQARTGDILCVPRSVQLVC
jgi:hypothetical protein